MKQLIWVAMLVAGQVNAQNNQIFGGGTADGWQAKNFLQGGNAIFRGGESDGWTVSAFAASPYSIFKGGEGDGWSKGNFLQAGNALYNGGSGDGWSFVNFLQAGNAIFRGGDGDGRAFTNFLQNGNAVFNGGIGDGWASTYRALGVLPLQFVFFQAEKARATARLTWQTENEIGTSHFTVQRSQNGTAFEAIGSVNAAGNAANRQSYSFTDVKPSPGFNYYRLQQVDKDGRFQLTPVRVLDFSRLVLAPMKTYPVPVTSVLTLELPTEFAGKDAVISLVNAGGVVIQQIRVSGSRTTERKQLQVSFLPAGVYTIHVVADGYSNATLFVKQ